MKCFYIIKPLSLANWSLFHSVHYVLCGKFLSNAYVCLWPFFCGLGPDVGSPPLLVRKKLLTVLSESGKISSIIDDVSIVKRYASESSHAFPVSSDDEALSKAIKEVKLITSYIYFSSGNLAISSKSCFCLLLILGKE